MAPTLISPNTGNYMIGKGIMEFKKAGDPDFRDMGNAPTLEFTPTLETLDHFSSREGTRTKDLKVTLTRSGTLRIILEEFTPDNLAIALLGTIDEAAVGGPEIEIFSVNSVSGELKFTATNDIGPKWDYHYYNVSFNPSAAFGAMSEEWGQIELEGEVLPAAADHATAPGKVGIAKLTNLDDAS